MCSLLNRPFLIDNGSFIMAKYYRCILIETKKKKKKKKKKQTNIWND